MIGDHIAREAAFAVADSAQWQGDRFVLTHAGDRLGRVLGWAWRTDPDKIFMRAVTDYASPWELLSNGPWPSPTCPPGSR